MISMITTNIVTSVPRSNWYSVIVIAVQTALLRRGKCSWHIRLPARQSIRGLSGPQANGHLTILKTYDIKVLDIAGTPLERRGHRLHRPESDGTRAA
ncbi:hypothetical protein ACX4MT_04090 [Roseomonas mucosa]